MISSVRRALEAGELLTSRFRADKIILDLVPDEYAPEDVHETRMLLNVSQALFAQFLGVTVSAVQKWERGAKPPTRPACRIMDEIQRDPEYWKNRLVESIRVCSPS